MVVLNSISKKSATKFGALVTSIVLLAACSAKQIKQEEQALMQPTPEPAYTQPLPEPQQAAWPQQRKKRKTRIVKKNKAVRAQRVAKASKRKKNDLSAATAQVQPLNNQNPPAPPSASVSSGMDLQAQVTAQPLTPAVPPPPVFETPASESGFFTNLNKNWPMLSVVVMTLALFALAVRNRMNRKPRRKLIYN